MASEISTRNVTKTFKKSIALDNVSISASNGINIVIGPNGAGKSTLLRCVGGLYKPESGTVRIFDKDPYYDDAIRERVSLLSDNYALYDKLSVIKNLLFFGRLYGNTDAETKKISENMLKKLDAYQYIDKKAGELSRGTKQKIALCRALLNNPDVLLLDEPTAFLDAVSSERVHIMLEEFVEQGKTILYATQRLNEATRFRGNIFIIKKGRISRKLGYKDLYGSVLKGATVNIRLADSIGMNDAKKIPYFVSIQGSIMKIKIRGYKDINEAAEALIGSGHYILSIDYTEPLIEDVLAD